MRNGDRLLNNLYFTSQSTTKKTPPMTQRKSTKKSILRIEYLGIKNYRSLKDIELKKITPLTVFLGPNGSGKSTIFDVFAFLSECFSLDLRKAWDKRGRRSRIAQSRSRRTNCYRTQI
jgi:predicted ATPase